MSNIHKNFIVLSALKLFEYENELGQVIHWLAVSVGIPDNIDYIKRFTKQCFETKLNLENRVMIVSKAEF